MRRVVKAARAAGIAASSVSPAVGAHFDRKACNGTIKMSNGNGAAGSQTIYNDHRSPILLGNDAIPAEAENPIFGPTTGRTGGSWIYLEFNNHAGLQTGGHHAVLGEAGRAIGASDGCDTSHGGGTKYDLLLR